jgi:hypothetical protein
VSWRRWVFYGHPFLVVVVLSLITTVLLIMATRRGTYLVEVTLQPESERQARVTRDCAVIRTWGGEAYFDFKGELVDPYAPVKEVHFEIKPSNGATWFPQAPMSLGQDRTLRGLIQLGSRKYPLIRDQEYSFRTVDQNEETLLEGTLRAKVTRVEGADQLLVSLGILASVVQVLHACFGAARELRRNDRSI